MKLKFSTAKIPVICALVLLSHGSGGPLQPEGENLRVLFIGNSYTYYHSLPQLFKAMAETRFPGRQFEVRFVGGGGATLKQHWEAGRASTEIETGSWDFVVLQEQSMLGSAVVEDGKRYIGSPDPFYEYARLFDNVIKQHGAVPVFFMTWSPRDRPNQQKYLTHAYMTIARKLGSRIAPVGMIWENLREQGEIGLYEKDGSHPSVRGSFLAAMVIFATIFDTGPAGIPGRLKGYEILRGGKLAGELSVLSDLPASEVKTMRDASAAVLAQQNENGGYLEVERAVSEREAAWYSPVIQYISTAQGQAVIFIVLLGVFLIARSGKRLIRRSGRV